MVMSKRSTQSAVTAREREVLSLIEAHLTNGQIADELCLSVRTVESHVSSLMRKLQVTDRRSLARRAERVGLGRPADHGRWPTEVSSFIGRESERDDLLAAVAEHRMVTVTGPGGVGKTRLARLVARDLAATRADGGWFVDLVRVTDPDMVDAAVAAAIGVVEPPGGSLSDAVAAALSGSDGVLLLDNCEHVLGAAGACVRRLLTSCPGLQVTVTSRVRLAAPFEWVYEVPGLSVVDGGGDAVRLFLERAAAAGSTTDIDPRQVSTLCRALDGMALAVELAAGRYPSLGIDGLLASLDHRLRYLTSGASGDHRHRSLADAIAWSYDLLGPADQTLIGAVSVFASWFDVDAAAAIAEASLTRSDVADTLARLADHHLVVVAPGQPTRYRVLETIRQYADDRLSRHGTDRGARPAPGLVPDPATRPLRRSRTTTPGAGTSTRRPTTSGRRSGGPRSTGSMRPSRTWPKHWLSCCCCAASWLRRSGGTSRPPGTRSPARTASVCCGSRPGPPPPG